jgi:hypothetical protein
MESREKAERERMKDEASEPKAPKVSRMKGTKVEAREEAREAYLVVLEVAWREATASGVAGMER